MPRRPASRTVLWLAINVAAMLIAFIAFIALFDIILGEIYSGLTLDKIFGWVFAPVAFLLGVEPSETGKVGSLLGHQARVQRARRVPEAQGVEGNSRLPLRALAVARGLRADGVRELRVGGHSTRRHRRDRARPPARPRQARHEGAVRRIPGDAH